MVVQFNLLPDVKLEFNKSQHVKKVVYSLSTLVIVVVLSILILSFFVVNVLQKKLIDNANNDIKTYSQKLNAIPDIAKVLTIQNQLKSLPALHQKTHEVSRLFTYLPQVTPTNTFMGALNLDTASNNIKITGTADTVATVNTFVDTLKFTNFTTNGDSSKAKPAFSQVLLSQVGRSSKGATYTIVTKYDPVLFDNSQNVTLVVPNQITSRSVINAPDINSLLFNGETGNKTDQGGQ